MIAPYADKADEYGGPVSDIVFLCFDGDKE
jgi:hypothetical protein